MKADKLIGVAYVLVGATGEFLTDADGDLFICKNKKTATKWMIKENGETIKKISVYEA